MSRATKRKHVLKEVFDDDFSVPTSAQEIVRVLESRGNNLHQVESPDGVKFLVSMPVKFRRTVWVKRGDYLLIEPIAEGDKVKGEMIRALTHQHIKYFQESKCWPEAFARKTTKDEQNDDEGLFVNTNRPVPVELSSSDDESISSSETETMRNNKHTHVDLSCSGEDDSSSDTEGD